MIDRKKVILYTCCMSLFVVIIDVLLEREPFIEDSYCISEKGKGF